MKNKIWYHAFMCLEKKRKIYGERDGGGYAEDRI